MTREVMDLLTERATLQTRKEMIETEIRQMWSDNYRSFQMGERHFYYRELSTAGFRKIEITQHVKKWLKVEGWRIMSEYDRSEYENAMFCYRLANSFNRKIEERDSIKASLDKNEAKLMKLNI